MKIRAESVPKYEQAESVPKYEQAESVSQYGQAESVSQYGQAKSVSQYGQAKYTPKPEQVQYVSHNERETEEIGAALARTLQAGDVIALRGGLGMGKTAFVRGLARGLGCPGRVTSPTFAIVNEYDGGRLTLFHFDLYRLDGAGELWDLGWDEYQERGGVRVVEWSERAGELFPRDTIFVTLERVPEDENARRVTIQGADLKAAL